MYLIIKNRYFQAPSLDTNLHGCEDGSRYIDPRLDALHPSLLGQANELGKLQHASSGNHCYNNRGQRSKSKLSVQEKYGDYGLDWRGPKLVQGCSAVADTFGVRGHE